MLKLVLFGVALFWTAFITFFCLIKSSSIPTIEFPFLDKLVHAFFYFVFTIVWFLFIKMNFRFSTLNKPLAYSALFSFAFGVFIEIMQQYYTTTRQADILDVVFNVIGSLLSILVVLQCIRFNLFTSILKN